MKNCLLIALALVCSVSQALAGGSEATGGGDLCENRFQLVRDDLSSWIVRGGHRDLVLPAGLDSDRYSELMSEQIKSAKIRCVGKGDTGYPVTVVGTPKICRYDRNGSVNQITCDFSKFSSLTESEQYVLVHHEFAGLAGIERPSDDVSTYEVSNQISAFLEDTVVKKLAVKPKLFETTTEPSKPFFDIRVGDKFSCSLQLNFEGGGSFTAHPMAGRIKTKLVQCGTTGYSAYCEYTELSLGHGGADIGYEFEARPDSTTCQTEEDNEACPPNIELEVFQQAPGDVPHNPRKNRIEIYDHNRDYSQPFSVTLETTESTDYPGLKSFTAICKGERP